MSECRGDVKFYHRSFAVWSDDTLADGLMDPICLCDNHLSERKREERAKIVLDRRGRGPLIGYHELPRKNDADARCADADRQRLGLPERPPERPSYWDDLFRESREKAFREIEEVALRSEDHTSELQSRPPLVCPVLLEQNRAEWLRKPAAAAGG